MYPKLQEKVTELLPRTHSLPAERRVPLDRLVSFVLEEKAAGRVARLNFICTHNSRRSHFGQLWAQTAAAHYGVADVETFSGGTEATAFHPRAIAALERTGFMIENPGGENPRVLVRWAPEAAPAVCFSKKYDDPVNPKDHFAAVMTCTDADENCPVVFGATLRLSLPYEDPKIADGTPEEAARYEERSAQIATEMLYVFSRVAARETP